MRLEPLDHPSRAWPPGLSEAAELLVLALLALEIVALAVWTRRRWDTNLGRLWTFYVLSHFALALPLGASIASQLWDPDGSTNAAATAGFILVWVAVAGIVWCALGVVLADTVLAQSPSELSRPNRLFEWLRAALVAIAVFVVVTLFVFFIPGRRLEASDLIWIVTAGLVLASAISPAWLLRARPERPRDGVMLQRYVALPIAILLPAVWFTLYLASTELTSYVSREMQGVLNSWVLPVLLQAILALPTVATWAFVRKGALAARDASRP